MVYPSTGCPLGIADQQGMAASAFSTRIPGIDPGRDDPFVPGFVLGVLEDASLHPERPFAIAPTTVLAFLWLELA